MVNIVAENHSREELINRACYRIAWNINHMWSETGSSDTRLFLEPLIPESFITVGKSKKGSDRKEHVVPRVVLCGECHRMYSEGSTIEEVAEIIKENLKIVLISKDEQEYLDYELGLKMKMPPGWSFGDSNPFRRLEFAGIEYDLI